MPAVAPPPEIVARFEGTVHEASAPLLDRDLSGACAVWVSSDLRWFTQRRQPDCYAQWQTDDHALGPVLRPHCWCQYLAADMTQTDEDDRRRAYRRLDADWYAYLHQAMCRARSAHQQGRLADQTYQTMRERINALWRWARECDPSILDHPMRPLPPGYDCPRPWHTPQPREIARA